MIIYTQYLLHHIKLFFKKLIPVKKRPKQRRKSVKVITQPGKVSQTRYDKALTFVARRALKKMERDADAAFIERVELNRRLDQY